MLFSMAWILKTFFIFIKSITMTELKKIKIKLWKYRRYLCHLRMGRRCKSALIFTNNQENAKSWYHFCQLLLKVQGNTRACILLWEHKPQQPFRRIICHLIILHGKIFWPGNSRTFISHRQKTYPLSHSPAARSWGKKSLSLHNFTYCMTQHHNSFQSDRQHSPFSVWILPRHFKSVFPKWNNLSPSSLEIYPLSFISSLS